VCGRNGKLHEIVCANEPKNHPHKERKALPGGIMYDGWCGKLTRHATGLKLASPAASTFLTHSLSRPLGERDEKSLRRLKNIHGRVIESA
jgi:hypothetical protein